MSKKSKTVHPPKTFDDALAGLAGLCVAKRWSFSGVEKDQLTKDAEAQRTERAEHDKAESNFNALHETFSLNQAERYRRFISVLNAARSMFRGDKAVLAELERFKRESKRAQKREQNG